MKQVSNGVIIDGKEVFVFKVSECDAVVATNVYEAINYYKEYTDLDDSDIYFPEEVFTMDLNTKILQEEGKTEKTTLLEELKKNGYKNPYILCSWY